MTFAQYDYKMSEHTTEEKTQRANTNVKLLHAISERDWNIGFEFIQSTAASNSQTFFDGFHRCICFGRSKGPKCRGSTTSSCSRKLHHQLKLACEIDIAFFFRFSLNAKNGDVWDIFFLFMFSFSQSTIIGHGRQSRLDDGAWILICIGCSVFSFWFIDGKMAEHVGV